MITQEEFDALVSTYAKHEWLLRRVVVRSLSDAPKGLASDIPVDEGVVDAAWFSREPKPGTIPWEIRFLGTAQYALVEYLDESSPDFNAKVHQTEQRLADAVAKARTA